MSEINTSGNKRGLSPNSRKNLELGRKTNNHTEKGYSITRIQRDMLPQPCPYAPGKTWAEWLAERGLALAGENARYYVELLDRLEGKVIIPIGGNGEPVTFKVIHERAWEGKNIESDS